MRYELGKHFLNLALGVALTGIVQPLVQEGPKWEVLLTCALFYLILASVGLYFLKEGKNND